MTLIGRVLRWSPRSLASGVHVAFPMSPSITNLGPTVKDVADIKIPNQLTLFYFQGPFKSESRGQSQGKSEIGSKKRIQCHRVSSRALWTKRAQWQGTRVALGAESGHQMAERKETAAPSYN